MKATLHRIGNSQGVILPKPLLEQVGFTERDIEMTVEQGAIVLRKSGTARSDWAQAAARVAKAQEDGLIWPEFGNEGDAALEW